MDLVLEAQPLQSLHTALLCSINSAGLQAWRLKNIPVHLNCLPAWYRVFPPSSYLVVKLWLIIQSRLNKPLILGQISQAEPASEPGGFCSDCKNQNKAHSLFCHEFVYFWIVIMELDYFLLCWRVIWYPLYHWSKCGFASPYLRRWFEFRARSQTWCSSMQVFNSVDSSALNSQTDLYPLKKPLLFPFSLPHLHGSGATGSK